MQKPEIESFYPTSQEAWRSWLIENHISKQSVWVIFYKKKSQIPSLSWSQAVDEALCFGWIDSTAKTIDSEKFIQFFSKRKPKSVWSKVNKTKVEQLIGNGLMTKAGFDSIEIAKQNGSWTILDEVEELIIPNDLEEAFQANLGTKDYYFSLSKSARKGILYKLVLAKRSETRHKRICEIIEICLESIAIR
ncbi:uncharacterized protein YdeI (YjbR/CyaY-like superfamily) [Arcicella aurantiaca]|uniref:Uncharacterized protein YdeI (YjbR/CyaY-like superfamily) n=1 Tax=Arcicella aurantiaca TaxID=591202 RepID=A0A316EK34_9BACT|nr:YdeI/OmpD-associated family protein [Arcicella aurantiaca]PWK29262.1 uncharacterized protein YdeI (YjbR/CyaY-like superfamily) [Arcicella aurantiaca]